VGNRGNWDMAKRIQAEGQVALCVEVPEYRISPCCDCPDCPMIVYFTQLDFAFGDVVCFTLHSCQLNWHLRNQVRLKIVACHHAFKCLVSTHLCP